MTLQTRLLALFCVFVLMVRTGAWAIDVLGGIDLNIDCVHSKTAVSVEWCKKAQCGDDEPTMECWEQNTLYIETVSYHKDKGCYLCVDIDTNETIRNESFYIYEYPKRVWLTDETGVPLESVVGRIGDIVSLICNVPCSNPEPRVQWKDGDGSSLGDGSLSPEGECNYTSVINVPLTHALAGNTITCSAQNIEMWPAVSAKSEVVLTPSNVTIYTSPSHGKSSDIVLELGETANVTCEARDAYPPPKFQWKLDGKPLPTYAAEPDNDTSCRNYSCFNLRSLQVKLQDHGKMLSCTAWNHRGNMVTTASKIKTRGPPEFEKKHDIVEVYHNHRTKMAVYFFTYPHFINVKWERLIDHQWTPINRRLHSEDSAVVRFRSKEKDISLCGNLTTLVIPVVQEEDAGVYRVTVANEVGQKSLNITVKIKTPDSSDDFPLFWLVVVAMVGLVVGGSIWITIMYRKLRRRKNRERFVSLVNLQSTPASSTQSRPRLNTPRASVAGTYADIDELIATNMAMFPITPFREAAIDVEGYEIPVIRSPKGRRPMSDVCDYVNTRDRNPHTTASA